MLRFLLLLVSSSAALAHPGHGALEVHWHAEDLLWWVFALVCIGLLIKKALKK
jgi:hypothetical protein